MVKRGEMWWVELPDQKARPYLVLTRNAAIPVVDRVIAVPATSSIRNIPSELVLGTSDGMSRDCALSFDNIETIPKWAFRDRISALRAPRLAEVCSALAIATGCE